MNIQEAKNRIEESVVAYLMKNEQGYYRIPIERQRPIFVLGVPGIGKTAIMEQIAQELDLALVTYSMTHHTRQSALGLPFITHKDYDGQQFDVSEYTMSEIIASIYEVMERSGKKEGILFLDEINCVSETLAPSMLQFLQYKTFGRHAVPDGWVIVTAGNPPEYNRSVRDFDVVTMDRLRIMEIDADYEVWREYALNHQIHSAILTFLDIKKNNFYDVENTVDGRTYVTARGWEDLSETMYLNEELGYVIDESLISQYLGNKRIVREFSAYYDLYNKYKKDYRIYDILNGKADREIIKRAKAAAFDERISIVGLLLDAVLGEITENIQKEYAMRALFAVFKEVKTACMEQRMVSGEMKQSDQGENTGHPAEEDEYAGMSYIESVLQYQIDEAKAKMEREETANSLSGLDRIALQTIISVLEQDKKQIQYEGIKDPAEAFALIKKDFDEKVGSMKAQSATISSQLQELFAFVEKAFGDGNEMLILVTQLTANYNSAKFISEKGCKEYEKYNQKYMLYERGQEIAKELEQLEI